MTQTIRERMLERQTAHSRDYGFPTCVLCKGPWPCPDWVAADDTITDLKTPPLCWTARTSAWS